jgi:hypothetical protein
VRANGGFGLVARPRRVDAVVLPGYRGRSVVWGKGCYTTLAAEVKCRRVVLVDDLGLPPDRLEVRALEPPAAR